jgi:hypothetical protein
MSLLISVAPVAAARNRKEARDTINQPLDDAAKQARLLQEVLAKRPWSRSAGEMKARYERLSREI